MSLDIKGNILRDKFYNSIYGQKVLIICEDNPSLAYDISKQGFDVTILTDNNQSLTYNNFKVNQGDVLTFQSEEQFDTIIVGNKVSEFTNLKFLFNKIYNDFMHTDSKIIFIYDMENEIDNFIISKIFSVNKDLMIDNFDMNLEKTFISLARKGNIKIDLVIRKIESVLTYKHEISIKEIEEVAKITEKSKPGNNIDYQEYNRFLSKYNEMVHTNKQYQQQVTRYQQKMNEIRDTVRYRIGDEIVASFKRPGVRTIKLPFTLIRLLREGKQREQERKIRKTNVKIRTNQPQKVQNNQETNYVDNEVESSIIIERIKNTQIYQKSNNKKTSEITVACILDEFSYECFSPEANFHQLSYHDWKKEIDHLNPTILFVESAWMGGNDEWKYKLINIGKKENTHIEQLVNYCKSKGIPTVFWNKEDPPNFDRFIDCARLFDYIFTTEINVVERYKKIVQHDNVFALPFAAQPKIHNPVNFSYKNKNGVAFAGSWYANRHFERQLEMNYLLSPARDYDIDIFDRFHGFESSNNINYKFPEIYHDYIKGKLEYEDMIKAYRIYSVFLNVNSVNDSETMFSRRVFEILACGTNIISTPSVGVQKLFKDIAFISNSDEQTNNYLEVMLNNKEISRRRSVKGIREVYSKHLYSHRFAEILQKLKIIGSFNNETGVTVVTSTMRPEFLNNILDNYERQTVDNKQLIIVVNSEESDYTQISKELENKENILVLNGIGLTLGEALNKGITDAKYDVIAKFDDDDYYGDNYLLDALHAFEYTDASIVGRKSIFMYFEESKTLALKYPNTENKFQDFVYGATLVFKKEVWNESKFPNKNQGEDSHFIKHAIQNGYKIFSTNPYNYTYIRRNSSKHHTWEVDNFHLLRKTEIVGYMDKFIEHVTV